jgi:hypothetical protein
MAEKKYITTADRIDHLDVESSGLVVRKHTPDAQLSSAFMALSVCVLLLAVSLFYDSLKGFYLCVGSGIIVGFVSLKLERIRKAQVSTEFLNAIFSSAIGNDYRFCMAAHRDGEIVYVNRGFHDLFAEFVAQPELNVKQLCTMSGIGDFERKRIETALQGDAMQCVQVSMNTGIDHALEPISLLIEPVAFPKGYVLIRGN